MSAEGTTAPTVGGFQPPPGYVLVPQSLYDMLLEGNKPAAPPVNQETPLQSIHLRAVRAFHLGDIKANMNPDEVMEWVPNRYLTIRGRQYNQLGSFLILWNKTYEGSASYDPEHPPYFEVLNPDALSQLKSYRKVRSAETENQRMQREEQQGDSARIRRTEPEFATTPQPGNLPPRGSQARRDLISSRPPERLLGEGGHNDGAQMSVQDFGVSVTPDDQRIVASIDGPAAQAKELLPLEEGGTATSTRTRKPRR